MERRRFKRFPTDLSGVIIIQENSYVGNIKNISEEGVGYLSMLDFFYDATRQFPHKRVTLIIETTEMFNLDCEIVWSGNDTGETSRPFFGMRIMNPSDAFRKFVQSLAPYGGHVASHSSYEKDRFEDIQSN